MVMNAGCSQIDISSHSAFPSYPCISICIYTESIRYYMPYDDVVNPVTVTKTTMRYDMPPGCRIIGTTAVLIWVQVSNRACPEVSDPIKVSHRPALTSQLLWIPTAHHLRELNRTKV